MQLRRLGHIIFGMGYLALAAVTALLLVVFRPKIDTVVVILAAGQVVLAGGLLHEVVARLSAERKNTERLVRMRQAYEELVEMVLHTRQQLKHRPDPASNGHDTAEVHSQVHGRAMAPDPAIYTPAHPVQSAVMSPDTAAIAVEDDSDMVSILRAALNDRRVECFLQPVVSLPGRKHRGYEALSRIRQQDGSLILPDRYLAIAEREQLITALDLMMINSVISLIRETDRRHHAVNFFCNLSARTLSDQSFLNRFLGGDSQNLHGKLVFELSQTDLLPELQAAVGVVSELGNSGFRFSMDRVEHFDMDAALLHEHKIKFVKLKVAHLSSAERSAGMLDLTRRPGGHSVELIAEKIETEQQLHEAEALGITSAQGFLFGEPRLSRRLV